MAKRAARSENMGSKTGQEKWAEIGVFRHPRLTLQSCLALSTTYAGVLRSGTNGSSYAVNWRVGVDEL